MGLCDICGHFLNLQNPTLGCFRPAFRSLVTLVVVSLLVPHLVEAGAPYQLGSLLKIKPDKLNNSGKRVVSTATNSPIYYINKLDLSSLFFNLLPNAAQKKRPQLSPHNLTSFLSDLSRDPHPFQRLPLPFVSNAKPIGSYKLKPAHRPPGVPFALPQTTSSTRRPFVSTVTSTALPQQWATQPSSVLKYTPSKIIRLKTKFLANGQPSAVYVFKSPSRRYSLKDILRRPLTPTEDRSVLTNDFKRKGKLPFW